MSSDSDPTWTPGIGSLYGAMPCQGFGRLPDGQCWYFRSRHGGWSLTVGPEDHAVPEYVHDAVWATRGTLDEFSGPVECHPLLIGALRDYREGDHE